MNMIDFDPTTDHEMEDRLRRTFNAVAEQTTVEPPSEIGFLPTVTEGQTDAVASGPRAAWLVGAAASVLVALLGVVYFGQARDITETTPASQNEGVTDTDTPGAIDLETIVGEDGVLHLLPANAEQMVSEIEASSQSSAAGLVEADIDMIAVGRPAENGVETMYNIFYSTDIGSFHIARDESQEIAGRTLYESYDEGVIEDVGDGTFIGYQTEFGDPTLETLVAGTTVVDGHLVWDGGDSDLVEVARLESPTASAASSLVHEHDVDDDSPVPPFRLITMRADDPDDVLVMMAGPGQTSPRSITINGRPGYVDTFGIALIERSSLVGWSPADGYISMLMVALPDDEAIVFAEQMVAVTEAEWEQTVLEVE